MAHYNHALGTLEHLSERIGSPADRRVVPTRTAPVRRSRWCSRRCRCGVASTSPTPGTPSSSTTPAGRAGPPACPAATHRGRIPCRSRPADGARLDEPPARGRGPVVLMVIAVILLLFGALAYHRQPPVHNPRPITPRRPSTTSHPTSRSARRRPRRRRPDHRATPTPRPPCPPDSSPPPRPRRAHRPRTRVPFASTYQLTLTGTGARAGSQVDRRPPARRRCGRESSPPAAVQNVQATGATTVEFGTCRSPCRSTRSRWCCRHRCTPRSWRPSSRRQGRPPGTTSPSTTVPSNTTASSTAAFIVPSDSTASDSTASDTTASMTTAVMGSSPGSRRVRPLRRPERFVETRCGTRLWGRGSPTRLRDRVRRG